MEKITTFKGTYGWLSNFLEVPVVLDGMTYPSVENAYQAAKTNDLELRKTFLNCSSSEAKNRGKRVLLRSDWNTAKFDIMYALLVQKFTPGYTLASLLLATGDALLIEGNYWHDNIWGSCSCAKCGDQGDNALGKMLMDIRSSLGGPEYRDCSSCSDDLRCTDDHLFCEPEGDDGMKFDTRTCEFCGDEFTTPSGSTKNACEFCWTQRAQDEEMGMISFTNAFSAVSTGRVACFTGHRPNAFPFGYTESGPMYDRIIARLDWMISAAYQNGYRTFISGLALGVDTWAIERVAAFRVDHPDVVIVGAIPCVGQDSKWIPKARDRYQVLLQTCDAYGYVSMKTYLEDKGCMTDRNIAMVDASELLIAVWETNKPGGTGHAYAYAMSSGKNVLHYDWRQDKTFVAVKEEPAHQVSDDDDVPPFMAKHPALSKTDERGYLDPIPY